MHSFFLSPVPPPPHTAPLAAHPRPPGPAALGGVRPNGQGLLGRLARGPARGAGGEGDALAGPWGRGGAHGAGHWGGAGDDGRPQAAAQQAVSVWAAVWVRQYFVNLQMGLFL